MVKKLAQSAGSQTGPESGWTVPAGHFSKGAGLATCSPIKCFLSKCLVELTPHA